MLRFGGGFFCRDQKRGEERGGWGGGGEEKESFAEWLKCEDVGWTFVVRYQMLYKMAERPPNDDTGEPGVLGRRRRRRGSLITVV